VRAPASGNSTPRLRLLESLRDEAEAAGMTQAEFNELVQDPDLYQLEDKQLNESHKYELPK
jgi:hypothetical protein